MCYYDDVMAKLGGGGCKASANIDLRSTGGGVVNLRLRSLCPSKKVPECQDAAVG